MTEVDEKLAPPGYRARKQTHSEKAPLGEDSCEGCAFDNVQPSARYVVCRDHPCSRFGRPDRQSVIFEKIP